MTLLVIGVAAVEFELVASAIGRPVAAIAAAIVAAGMRGVGIGARIRAGPGDSRPAS